MILDTGIEVIITAFLAAFTAQFLKLIFYYMSNHKVNFKILSETGGMPSSHSAFVLGLSTSVALIDGITSTEFAIAIGFSMIVMYDAAGLRRSAGRMAMVLNRLVDDIYEHRPPHAGEKLIELLGHTPIEVLMGALLGIVIAFGYHLYLSGLLF